MRARDWILIGAAGVAGFAVVALCIVYAVSFRGAGGIAAVAPIGGPFTLTDDTGATVTEKTLAGKPYAMYFGYTYCPDVCPTTLFDLSRWIQKLGPDADKLNYVFVTVDPERDTPKLMHDYSVVVRQAHPRLYRHPATDRDHRQGVSRLLQKGPDQ